MGTRQEMDKALMAFHARNRLSPDATERLSPDQIDERILAEQEAMAAEQAAREKEAHRAALQTVADVLKGAIVFREGKDGEEKKYLVFFPGQEKYNSSITRRNAAGRLLKNLMEYKDKMGIADIEISKAGFSKQLKTRERRDRSRLSCMQMNDGFTRLLEQMGQWGVEVSIPIIPCDNLTLPEVHETMEKYLHDRKGYILPKEIRGEAPEEPAAVKKVRARAKKAVSHSSITMKPDPLPPALSIMRDIASSGVIANPGNENGGLSFFSHIYTTQSNLTNVVRHALGELEPLPANGADQPANSHVLTERVARINKRGRPVVRGLFQYSITPDQAAALNLVFDVPILREGNRVPLSAIKLFRRSQEQAADKDAGSNGHSHE